MARDKTRPISHLDITPVLGHVQVNESEAEYP